MGETINQIERDLAAERVDLSRNLGELETRARELTDWRRYYRNNPGKLIGAALAGGVVLGIIAGGSSSSSSQEYFAEGSEPLNATTPRPRGRAMSRIEKDWQHISDALMGVASAKVMEFVANMVPGFKEHLHPDHRDTTSSL